MSEDNNTIQLEVKDGGKYMIICKKPMDEEEMLLLRTTLVKFAESNDKVTFLIIPCEYQIVELK